MTKKKMTLGVARKMGGGGSVKAASVSVSKAPTPPPTKKITKTVNEFKPKKEKKSDMGFTPATEAEKRSKSKKGSRYNP